MNNLPKSDRTRETEQKYQDFKLTPEALTCPFCTKQMLIKEYKYWILLDNRFGYDARYKTSHMLAPKRHVLEEHFTLQEIQELLDIKKQIAGDYDIIQENLGSLKSRPDHAHLHLLIRK